MKRKRLEDVLDSIYNQEDLSTQCNRSLCCCKVACPQMAYSEFVSLITNMWGRESKNEKINLICKSVEYFFRYQYEKWGMEALEKPCLLLDDENKSCKYYEFRPLNCRLYGLWPKEDYEARVDKFAKAYEVHGLKREDLPLNKQCKFVKRKDSTTELTGELIDKLFERLDNLDKVTGEFSSVQVRQKENYRTFHDWLMLKVFGEDSLSQFTAFILAADRPTMEDQIEALKGVLREKFKNSLPEIADIV